MIIEYQRPKTISEALILLARKQPISYPLGGGTFLNRGMDEEIAVIDLQALKLDKISKKGNSLQVGATVKLQDLLEHKGLPGDLYEAINHEATNNLRQMATIGGTLVTANGRSPVATVMLALDASMEIQEMDSPPSLVRLGDWFPLRGTTKPEKLITKIVFPLNIQVTYENIARTPADQPIVSAAIAQWSSNRTRLVLGGWGQAPILAFDGPDMDGIEIAGKNAFSNAGDEWASAEYRREMAGVLALRCLKRLSSGR